MKVYLDDERMPPDGWVLARTVQEAMELLKTGEVERIDLDHDMGSGQPTGYDLCKWMQETGHWPKKIPMVHSQNPVGRENMAVFINRYGPYGGSK